MTESLVSQQQTADCFCRTYGNSAAQPYTDTNFLTRTPGERGLAQSELEQQSSIWGGPNEHFAGLWGSDGGLDNAALGLSGTAGDESLAEFCAELEGTLCADHIGGAPCKTESGNACFFAAVQHETACLLKQDHGASYTVCMVNKDSPVWAACQTSALTLVMAHCVCAQSAALLRMTATYLLSRPWRYATSAARQHAAATCLTFSCWSATAVPEELSSQRGTATAAA